MLNMSEQIQILALAVIVVHFVNSNGINVTKNATTVYLSSTTDGNECVPQPCANGGTCIDGAGDFSCLCRPGFEGNICEIEINRCNYGDVCYNGGTCIEDTYPYNCQCPAGFSGSNCEIVKVTSSGLKFVRIPFGHWLSLTCSESSPYLTWAWIKPKDCHGRHDNSDNVRHSIRIFHLAPAGIGDAGTYICKSLGSESEEYFNVEIVWSSVICTFENMYYCQWENELYGYSHVDFIPWKLEHGRLEDHSLGTKNGTYLTIQSKTRERSELYSPILPANQTICFEFWYRISINGSGTVSMALEDQCRDKRTEMFKATDTRHGHWVRAAVTILNTLVPNDYNVVITASKVLGSIDIDDLKFSNKHCQGFQGIVG